MDKCLHCGKEFRLKYRTKGVKKIFCSRRCMWDFPKNYECICKICGTKFISRLNRKRKEYCSVSCIERWPCQLCGKLIKGRIYHQSGDKKFCSRKCSNFVHRTIKSKKQYMPNGFANSIIKYGKIQCDICGIDNIEFLCVHHINGNRDDNSIQNLQTLCCNCHHRIHFGTGEKRLKCAQLAHMIVKYSS